MLYLNGRTQWGDSIERVGVIELSSRACKLIVGQVSSLQEGFSWSEFYSETVLTHLSRAIINGELTLSYFETVIWPIIEQQVYRAKERNVDLLVTVATSPLRQTPLQMELLQWMASKGLHVYVMSPMEEVQATYAGFEWALQQQVPDSMLFVDQGGGSTEISLVISGKIVDSLAVDYGTLNSSVRFQQMVKNGNSVQDALYAVCSELQNATTIKIQAWSLEESVPMLSAIGSAMTHLCKGAKREERHGMSWSYQALDSYIREQEQFLLSLSSEVLVRQSDTGYTQEQKCLQTYLGLSMLVVLMRHTGCESLVVNGIGMRFGVFHQVLTDEV